MSVYQISLIFWQQVTIGEEAKSKLMETLSADVDFLTKLHLMDYSLLLGKYIYLFSHAFFFLLIIFQGFPHFTKLLLCGMQKYVSRKMPSFMMSISNKQ